MGGEFYDEDGAFTPSFGKDRASISSIGAVSVEVCAGLAMRATASPGYICYLSTWEKRCGGTCWRGRVGGGRGILSVMTRDARARSHEQVERLRGKVAEQGARLEAQACAVASLAAQVAKLDAQLAVALGGQAADAAAKAAASGGGVAVADSGTSC